MPTPAVTFDFSPGPLYADADNSLKLSNLTLTETGAVVSSAATITATIDDANGNALYATAAWSNTGAGEWRYEIGRGGFTIVSGARYVLRLLVILDSGEAHTQDFDLTARGTSVRRYNWFGANIPDLIALFPGAKESDFGAGTAQEDRGAIEREMDAATERVVAACPKRVNDMLRNIVAEVIEPDADAGQTIAYLGLPSALLTGVTLFRNYANCPQSPKRSDAWAATNYALSRVNIPGDLTHGLVKVTIIAASALSLGDTLHASYALDTTSDAYSFRALADIVLKLAAAVLGQTLYAMETTVWNPVEEYRKWAEAQLVALQRGELVPSEIRNLDLCEDLDEIDDEIGSVTWHRA